MMGTARKTKEDGRKMEMNVYWIVEIGDRPARILGVYDWGWIKKTAVKIEEVKS